MEHVHQDPKKPSCCIPQAKINVTMPSQMTIINILFCTGKKYEMKLYTHSQYLFPWSLGKQGLKTKPYKHKTD